MSAGLPLSGLAMRASSLTTVQQPAIDKALIALDAVKSALNIIGNANNDFLNTLRSAASMAISGYCNRVFQLETIKDEFWPARDAYPTQVPGGAVLLQLTRWPVVTVTSVMESDTTLADPDDYRQDVERGQLIRIDGSGYPCRWASLPISVVYRAGYEIIPADLQDAALRLVTARWLARGRDPYLRQESIPGVRDVQYWVPDTPTGALPPDVRELIDGYRVPVIA